MKNLFDIQQLSAYEFGAIIITVLISGLVIGMVIGSMISRRTNKERIDAATQATNNELKEYRDQVKSHFDEGSNMLEGIAKRYNDLYHHIAIGAKELTDSNDLLNKLELGENISEPLLGTRDQTETTEPENK